MMKSLSVALLRLRAKSPRQLIRAILIRLWPLSLLVRLYYRMRQSDSYRDRANRHARLKFAAHIPPLDEVQQRCLDDLIKDGITTTSLAELTGDPTLLERLSSEADRLLSEPHVRQQIAERRAANNPKWYVVRALGYRMQVSLSDPLAELFTHPRILAVVNHYLGLCSRLCYADLWYNLPVRAGEPSIDSERWHRDHEDTHIVKLYCYLDTVDEDVGPLHYVRGSHAGGKYADLYPAKPSLGAYAPLAAVENHVAPDSYKVCTGVAGSIVLCDTAGLHRGGRSTTQPRILITGTYVSDAGIDKRTFVLENRQRWDNADASARYALGKS